MLFNSIDFAVFLPIIFILYWFVLKRNLKLQNLLIVIASYVFYGWWDVRFLSLIILSTAVDYLVGMRMSGEKNEVRRTCLLWTSLLVNLGFLGVFKYYNFFLDSFVVAFSFLGKDLQVSSLNVILPVGISFYTFQTLSYTIDVYRKKLEPTRDIVAFAAFVAYFPQLVAGPIERATRLLPQFQKQRTFEHDKAVDGMRQILWGLFKKVVIADNCAELANCIFDNSTECSGSVLVLGAVFFSFQIYGDFSGYSDIAIGTSKLFGIELMRNFAFPYFSRDIAEFWRRWHISLSTWFRDYLYIPLGGSRGGIWMQVRNILIVFAVSGFWHGANWTFIVWGVLNAIYFIPLVLMKINRNNMSIVAKGKLVPSAREFLSIMLTFSLTLVAWVVFRAESLKHALSYLSGIFSWTLFSLPKSKHLNGTTVHMHMLLVLLGVFILFEWIGREHQYAIATLGVRWKRPFRWILYYSIVFLVFWFGGREQEFIYFQF